MVFSEKKSHTVCVILTGGSSSRMGRDKANLVISGQTFLERLVRQFSALFPVYISVGETGRFDCYGAGELVDLHPGMGPLAGLEAAFLQTDAERVFLTATDLPFGSKELAAVLTDKMGDADACVIRRYGGETEPTFAVYHRRCLPGVQAVLGDGKRSFRGLFSRINVRWVEEAELSDFHLEALLQNVNTPEEYEKAVKTAENE